MFEKELDRSHTGSLKWDRYGDRDVLPMWVADMDFASPEPVQQALADRVAHGVYGYTIPYPSLLDSVRAYLRDMHRLEIAEKEIVWLPGLVPALNLVCRAFEGEVMTHVPIYPPFLTAPVHADRVLHKVPLRWTGIEWEIDWAAMEKAVTANTKVFFLCNPHNPVGRVFRKNELLRLLDFCRAHDLVVTADEIHCDLVLSEDTRHEPFLGLGDAARECTIALYAPSKTYNLPGLACAFAVIPSPQLRAAFRRAARGIITEVNAFGYAACEAAYRSGDPWRRKLIARLRRNREILQDFLRAECPDVETYPIEATYLAWIDVRSLGLDHPAAHFEEFGLGLSDGSQFATPGFLRLNFGCPQATLEEGLKRFQLAYDHATST